MPSFVSALCAAVLAWPMFRGEPGLRGLASGQLPDRLELRWAFKAGKPVKSSAAIVAGMVVVGCDDGNVYALAADTGKKLWSFKTEDAVEAAPLVLDNIVYIGSDDGNLYALAANTGTLKWKYKTDDKIIGGANWFRASRSGDIPVAAANDKGDKNVAPPIRLVIGSYDYKVHCLDAATGKAVWTFETANYVNGTPAVADGRIVFGGCDGQLHALTTTGKELLAVDAGAYIPGSPAVAGNRAYAGHYGNEVLCVDLITSNVVWHSKERNGAFFSSPAVTDDAVVIGARDKRLHCLDRATGQTRWMFPTQGDVDSSPVVCGDKVVFGSGDGKLYLVRLATGQLVWSYEIGRDLTASPAVADGLVVIGSEDGNVYAFGPPKLATEQPSRSSRLIEWFKRLWR